MRMDDRQVRIRPPMAVYIMPL